MGSLTEFQIMLKTERFRPIGEKEKTKTIIITLHQVKAGTFRTFDPKPCNHPDVSMSRFEMNCIFEHCVEKMKAAGSTQMQADGKIMDGFPNWREGRTYTIYSSISDGIEDPYDKKWYSFSEEPL
jgi:hypothetical protein